MTDNLIKKKTLHAQLEQSSNIAAHVWLENDVICINICI